MDARLLKYNNPGVAVPATPLDNRRPAKGAMRVLAGDIGGTKTLLAVAQCDGRRVRLLTAQRYESGAWPGLVEMAREFLITYPETASGIEAACFAVAGPVIEDEAGERAKVTNLSWEVDSRTLAHALGIARLRLINDFQGVGYGVEALAAQDLATLQAGAPRPRGTRAVLGAGTGLGQGLLVWCQGHYEALATEGGHVDFAPTDELQMELLRYLRGKYARVSVERVLSGPGLAEIYRFLCTREAPGGGEAVAATPPDPAAISLAALAASDRIAVAALELFVRIYGAQAGNLALGVMATGGVYLAGGIAPKIIAKLEDGAFLEAFNDKGRMGAITRQIPVHVILNPEVGLLGAALAASRLAAADRLSLGPR